MDREAWRAAIHGVTKSQTWLSDWTELNWTEQVLKRSKLSLPTWVMTHRKVSKLIQLLTTHSFSDIILHEVGDTRTGHPLKAYWFLKHVLNWAFRRVCTDTVPRGKIYFPCRCCSAREHCGPRTHPSTSEMHTHKQQSKKKKKFFSAPREQEVIQLQILIYFQSMSNLADSIISNSHKG